MERNVGKTRAAPTRDEIWRAMLGCLLSTQQKSGPKSPLNRFMRSTSPYLDWRACGTDVAFESAIANALSDAGLRRGPSVAKQLAGNIQLLNDDGWERTSRWLSNSLSSPDAAGERTVAREIAASLPGFGPKQSRNLLQLLGVSVYEVPIDSRLMKWLRKFGFPMELSASSLADSGYYELVLDGFQALCAAAELLPCMVDAAIFASFDREWTEANLVW
jgi:hypothetical protein